MATNPPYLPVDTTAVNWTDSSGTFHLHVFTTNGYTISERYITSGASGWTDGTLNQPANLISATAWTDANGGHIRVYATSQDVTTEWCLDGDESAAWYQGGYTLS